MQACSTLLRKVYEKATSGKSSSFSGRDVTFSAELLYQGLDQTFPLAPAVDGIRYHSGKPSPALGALAGSRFMSIQVKCPQKLENVFDSEPPSGVEALLHDFDRC
jgi:hypothetical protein